LSAEISDGDLGLLLETLKKLLAVIEVEKYQGLLKEKGIILTTNDLSRVLDFLFHLKKFIGSYYLGKNGQ
jgi:hypothetical protein